MSSVLAQVPLVCHPQTPCRALVALGAEISLTEDGGWRIDFIGVGDPAQIRFPAVAPASHTDELWRTTCFELFVALREDAYAEFNFSPSSAWAAYQFDHYRTGMRALHSPAPSIVMDAGRERLTLSVNVPEAALPKDRSGRVGLSAVIEERGGTISYWALAHPPGKADFHHRDCFALTLPSVDQI